MKQEAVPAHRPALFLDRDGVINIDHGHVHRKEDFDLIPGIVELVRRANDANWWVVVVTNQAGIAKGYYAESDFFMLMGWVRAQFLSQGARIDAVYHCPHHPDFGLSVLRDCGCRKPAPGMLFRASKDLQIDLSRSVLIGDKPSDIEAAQKAGVGSSYLFESGNVDVFAKQHFAFAA